MTQERTKVEGASSVLLRHLNFILRDESLQQGSWVLALSNSSSGSVESCLQGKELEEGDLLETTAEKTK